MRVEQRSTGVTGIDRRVRLNRAFDQTIVTRANWSLQATDDAGRQRSIQAERITNREHFLTDDQLV